MTHMDRYAAQHFLAVHDSEASGEAIQAALEWMEYSTDHVMAVNRIDRFMRVCDDIDPQELSRLKLSPTHSRPGRFPFTRAMTALAATILLLLIVTGALFLSTQKPSTFQTAHYETPRDTIRSIQLADGSNITLGGASAVSVQLHKKRREVYLLSGEALFEVAPDRNRPFIVQTKNGSTTAIGTAFNIHRGSDDTTVTVLHGRVEVLSQGEGYISKATLDKAMEVHYSDKGEMSTIKRVDPDAIASWRHGEFHFTNMSLSSVVDDLNRYSQKLIIIEDPALWRIKISGVVEVSGIIEWLDALSAIADVEVIETSHDIRIRAKSRKIAMQIHENRR